MSFWSSGFLWSGTTDKAELLARYAHYRNTSSARQLVKDLNRGQRAKLCRQLTPEGSTVLGIAASYGDCTFVDFLLDECGAEIDQRGTFPKTPSAEIPVCDNEKQVTPLWIAACTEDALQVVQTLVAHGADLDAASEDQSTPVCVASSLAYGVGNEDVVTYLVDQGADVHRGDSTGVTCLMYAVQDWNLRLCRLLLDRGAAASVNASDVTGNTALHHAIQSADDIDIVRLLLRHGADPSVRNGLGEDALITGALAAYLPLERWMPDFFRVDRRDKCDEHSDREIDADAEDDYSSDDEPTMSEEEQDTASQAFHDFDTFLDLLISELKPSAKRLADVYALIGARHVDERTNLGEAMRCWRLSAIVQRYQGAEEGSVTQSPPQTIYNHVEATDVQSLTTLADDEDKMYMQALVVRERILGPAHRDTIYWLMHRAVWYSDRNCYQRGLGLIKHALSLCATSSPTSLVDIGLFGVKSFCQSFWKRFHDDRTSVNFTDVAEVLENTIGAASKPSALVHEEDKFIFTATREDRALVRIYIHLIELLSRLASTDDGRQTVAHLARLLVRSNPTTSDGGTLLHHAVNPASSVIDDMFYSYRVDNMPSLEVVQALVAAEANVHATDTDGNTARQVAANSRGIWVKVFPTRAAKRVSAIMELLQQASMHPPPPVVVPIDVIKPSSTNQSVTLLVPETSQQNIMAQNIDDSVPSEGSGQPQSPPRQSTTTSTPIAEPMDDDRSQPVANQSVALPHETSTTYIVPGDATRGHTTQSSASQSRTSTVESSMGAPAQERITEAVNTGADLAEAAIGQAEATQAGHAETPM